MSRGLARWPSGSVEGDAATFTNYADYNYFFLFNPFDADIYDRVVEVFLPHIDRHFREHVDHLPGASSDRLLRADETEVGPRRLMPIPRQQHQDLDSG